VSKSVFFLQLRNRKARELAFALHRGSKGRRLSGSSTGETLGLICVLRVTICRPHSIQTDVNGHDPLPGKEA
jgi:hypothetical protein